MPFHFKLSQKGAAGLEVLMLTLWVVLLMSVLFAVGFEFYMYHIRLNQGVSALQVASERLQTELEDSYAAAAAVRLKPDFEAWMLNELELQYGDRVLLLEISWHPDGRCPGGVEKDDPLLHLVVAVPHRPSFFVEQLRIKQGLTSSAIKIHLDREIELDP